MSDPYIGEIRLVGFNFAPQDWLPCDGSLLQIASGQYQALFSVIGITYGGDGITNFALPNLNGRGIVGAGSTYHCGAVGGAVQAALTMQTMPAHTHGAQFSMTTAPTVQASVAVNTVAGTQASPTNAFLAPSRQGTTAIQSYASASTGTDTLGGVTAGGTAGGAVTVSGEGSIAPLPVPTLPPVLYGNYIICYNGLYPSRP